MFRRVELLDRAVLMRNDDPIQLNVNVFSTTMEHPAKHTATIFISTGVNGSVYT